MGKQFRIALAISLVALAGIGVLLVQRWRSHTYNGKTEREWIASLDITPGGRYGWDDEQSAWTKLGSNAVPILIHALQMKNGVVQKCYSNLWSKLPINLQNRLPLPLNVPGIHWCAAEMLSSVGTNYSLPLESLAKVLDENDWQVRVDLLRALNGGPLSRNPSDKKKILPAIIRCTKDLYPSVRSGAATALQYFPEDARVVIPALTTLLADANPDVRLYAAATFFRINPVLAEKSGVVDVAAQEMERQAFDGRFSMTLVQVYYSTDDKFQATDLLVEMAKTSDAALNALTNELASTHGSLRLKAAGALGRVGPRARCAVPALLRINRDEAELNGVREQAAYALQKIDPEAASKTNAAQ